MEPMDAALWDRYVAMFNRVLESMPTPREAVIEAPGILGRPGTSERPNGRFLITDDRAIETLDQIGDLHASTVFVLPEAARCFQRLEDSGRYAREDATAMVLEDLSSLEVALEPSLTIRPAALEPADGQVSLVSAAAADLRAEPVDGLGPDAFAAYLDSIPNASLLAAVDADGIVRATAGSAVFGEDARVFFVSTDPAMRGRGIGTAMTAAVLNAAASAGARRACLEGSAAGHGIYRRLGFEPVRPIVILSTSAERRTRSSQCRCRWSQGCCDGGHALATVTAVAHSDGGHPCSSRSASPTSSTEAPGCTASASVWWTSPTSRLHRWGR